MSVPWIAPRLALAACASPLFFGCSSSPADLADMGEGGGAVIVDAAADAGGRGRGDGEAGSGPAMADATSGVDARRETDAASSRALHVEGTTLRDGAGRQVKLRGMNIGGWLVPEDWMCGISGASQPRAIQETLEGRFDAGSVAALMSSWQDGWLTTRDLDRIQRLGFNVIRVPFGYRNLQDANGQFVLNASGSIDFSRLDWLVYQAGERAIYVILDLHVWPTQLQSYGLISEISSTGDAIRAQTASLWASVASHFEGNADIAAFDILNEPPASLNDIVSNTLYEAIRSADPGRVIAIESGAPGAGMGALPDPATMGWTNVFYELHQYGYKGPTLADDQAVFQASLADVQSHAHYDVPVFIGEFHVFSPNWSYVLGAYNDQSFSWAAWTNKAVDEGQWALVDYDTSVSSNVATDPYDTLMTKWTAFGTAPLTDQTALETLLSTAASAP